MDDKHRDIIREIEAAAKLKSNAVIAKIDPPETLMAHVSRMMALWSKFMNSPQTKFRNISSEEDMLVRLAIMHHDDGKASCAFKKWLADQGYCEFTVPDDLNSFLNEDKDLTIPHNFLSPAWLPWHILTKVLSHSQLIVLINAIYHHHSRTRRNRSDLVAILELDAKLGQPVDTAYLFSNIFIDGTNISEKEWRTYARVKGFLNRLDITSSRHYLNIEETLQCGEPSIGDLIAQRIHTPYSHQLSMASKSKQDMVIIGPTGSGKTEAALMWAGRDRLFYVLPAGSHVDSIFNRIHDIYGYDKVGKTNDISSTLAKTAVNKKKQEITKEDKLYADIPEENRLDRHIMVLTSDQAFDFVDKRIGSEMILSELSTAHVVIDEIQTFNAKATARAIYGLKTISDMGGRVAIVTSTFPPSIAEIMKQVGLKAEIQSFGCVTGLSNERHTVCLHHGMIDPNVILRDPRRKILVVCNTVRKAQWIYTELQKKKHQKLTHDRIDNVRVMLLHSAFRNKDRQLLSALLEQDASTSRPVKGYHGNVYDIADNEEVIWVTDRSIEVASDISFNALYTEPAPADVLIQRMGRVNRYGEDDEDEYLSYCNPALNLPNINIFNTGSGMVDIYNHSLCVFAIQWLNKKISPLHPFTENEKQSMIAEIYSVAKTKSTRWWRIINDELSKLYNAKPYVGFHSAMSDGEDLINVIDADAVEYLQQQHKWDPIVSAENFNDPILYEELFPLCSKLPRKEVPAGSPKIRHLKYGIKSTTCQIIPNRYSFDICQKEKDIMVNYSGIGMHL